MKDRVICAFSVSSLALIGVVMSAAWGGLPSGDASRRVAQDLDDFVQPRFQSEGVGIFSHEDFLSAHTVTGKALLSHAKQAKRDYVVYFFHCMPAPNKASHGLEKPSLRLLAKSSNGVQPILSMSDLSQSTTASLLALKQGKSTETMVGQWLVSARPVKAAHQSCLSCHVHSKLNDTLGAMVYAVKVTDNSEKTEG